MNRRFLTAVPVAALAIGITACSPGASGADPVPSIFTPGPAATSTQVQAAKTAGQQLLAKCQPKGDTATQWEVAFVFHPKATLAALEDCENVPPAKRQALASCAVDAAKAAYKGKGDKAAREASFVNGTARCVQAAQGAAPSPSASVSK